MSKAVLVMDMPKDCLHCKLRKAIHINEKCYQHCGLDTNGYCLESFFKEDDLKDGFKSEHCPLRELMEKKDLKNALTMTDLGWIEGYNACIDELLKGEEG